MKDYYDILGVPRDASQEDIKRAYRILAHQFHPDKNGGNDKRFKEINEAYRVLSGDRTKAEYDAGYDSGSTKQDGAASAGTYQAASAKRTWTAWASWIVVVIVIRLIFSSPTSTNSNTNVTQVPSTNTMYASATHIGNNVSQGTSISAASAQDTGTTPQYPIGKCVTESGVQICDLSYQSTDQVGNTRTIKMSANEIICHDLATDTNTDVQSDTININTDPQFCASDYGVVYIDPSIYVTKHYGDIQVINGTYTIPMTGADCLWTYAGGSGDIPYISISGSGGPDSSYYSVRAFCQDGSNQVDIFSSPSQ